MKLQLSLKSKWFEMTKNKVKTEDYRDITPYWCSRFLLQNGKKQKQEFWDKYLFYYKITGLFDALNGNDKIHRISIIEFSQNIMTLGYPKSNDISKILKLEHKGIEVRAGKTEWGTIDNTHLYFVIKHAVCSE